MISGTLASQNHARAPGKRKRTRMAPTELHLPNHGQEAIQDTTRPEGRAVASSALPPFPQTNSTPLVGSRMNGMGFGWGERCRLRDSMVHEIQTIICSDLQSPKRNYILPGEGARLETGTWSQ